MSLKALMRLLELMMSEKQADEGKLVEVRLGPLSDPRGITFLVVGAEVDQHGRLVLVAREAA